MRSASRCPNAKLGCEAKAAVDVYTIVNVWERVALRVDRGTMGAHMEAKMEDTAGSCSHPVGVRIVGVLEFQCPACWALLGMEGLERWVRAAEKVRDEAYFAVEGDGLAGTAYEEHQREVFRRRKVLYEVRSAPSGGPVARPEMVLISYDVEGDSYECRIFYKEPRPAFGPERVGVEADLEPIMELRSHPDPNVRLVSGKVEEFHALRARMVKKGNPPPARRVYYSNEL